MKQSPTMEEAIHTLMLTRMPGLTASKALRLVSSYGTATAAWADTDPQDAHWAALLEERATIAEVRARCEQEIEFCEAHQIQVIPYASDCYPERLRDSGLADPPLQLFYRGNAPLSAPHIISVVGTRRITEYGKAECDAIVRELAGELPDAVIVSGLAYGVDIHAHRAALASGLSTIGVLAHGLDRIYPALHRPTAARMVEQGGLLTEYMSGVYPDKGNFIRRNRIVAALTPLTLVVESAVHGGALITARLARSIGAAVYALPGRLCDPCSEGCNNLIRSQEAKIFVSVRDLLEEMHWTSAGRNPRREPQLFDSLSSLSPDAAKVLQLFEGCDPISINRLASLTGFSITTLSSILYDLVEANHVRDLPGNRFRRIFTEG